MDDLLLSLFRDEISRGVQTLSDGLVALEQDATNVARIEPLMRAAHSIKGAARVVAVEPVMHVAHAMEDCLVAAQHGQLTLSSDDVDVLLEGVDWLTRIAAVVGPDFDQWVAQHRADIDRMIDRLRAVRQGRGVAAAAPASDRPAAKTAAGTEPAGAPEASVVAAAKSPSEPAPVVQRSSAESSDGVVRVAARSLTRLLGLAGESLVEARWLQPFAKSLVNLRRDQDRLADMLDELDRAALGAEAAGVRHGLIDDMRQRIGQCRRQLTDRIEAFENHARISDDLNSRLYNEIIASRMRPFADGTQGLPRLVRDLGRDLGKQVRLQIVGEDTSVDRDVLERLDAPLNHLLRNAIDHGVEPPADRIASGKPETASIRIDARHSAGMRGRFARPPRQWLADDRTGSGDQRCLWNASSRSQARCRRAGHAARRHRPVCRKPPASKSFVAIEIAPNERDGRDVELPVRTRPWLPSHTC